MSFISIITSLVSEENILEEYPLNYSFLYVPRFLCMHHGTFTHEQKILFSYLELMRQVSNL